MTTRGTPRLASPPIRESTSGPYADHETEEYEGQEVVDDAAGHDDSRHTRIGETEVLQALEGDRDGGRRHRDPHESCADEVQAEESGDAEADGEGRDGTDDGDQPDAREQDQEIESDFMS